MQNFNFQRQINSNYNLTTKHLFKKQAGNAKYYYQLQNDETLKSDLTELSKLYQNNIPFRIYGMHTNLYITQNGYNGLYVDTSPKGSTITFNEQTEEFTVSGNVLTSQLVNYTMNLGYDFASLTGIPGMVSSGIVGNASWANGKVYGEYVKSITLFDFEKCEEIEITPDENFFATRNSFLKQANKDKTQYYVIKAVLKSEYIGQESVRAKYEEQMHKRKESLKIGFQEGCAGSIWSNIDMREKTGKSFRQMLLETTDFDVNFNGARYSSYGSRFFTTDETTTDADVAKLMKFTIDKLEELYHIKPLKEVLILDYDGEIDLDAFIERYLAEH